MADVRYIVTADTKGATTQIKKVDDSIDGMKKQAQKAQSPLKGMFASLAKGLVATAALGTAIHKMTGFLKNSIEAAKEQEKAENALTVALQSTGREVPINADHFKKYAMELQSATKYGDEQIMSAQSLLIQLTDLDQKGLDAATEGALGLATVFQTDLKSATNLVAKALAGNYGALSRYGISVTDLNTEEEKRASLLEQLGTLYQRATGEVDTYEGRMTQLKNSFGDLMEQIGGVVVKSEAFRDALQLLRKTIDNLVKSGLLEKWLSKIDMLFKKIPILQRFRADLVLLNLMLEKEVAIQERAKLTAEAWIDAIKKSETPIKILGFDVMKAAKAVANFIKEEDKAPSVLNDTTDAIAQQVKELMKVEEVIGSTVLPAYREWSGLAYNTQEEIKTHVFNANEEIGQSVTETVEASKSLWDEMADGLQTKWASTIGEVLRGATSLKDGLKGIWDAMLEQFTDIIGQMVAKWVTDFIGKVVSSASTGFASAGQSIAGVAKSIADTVKGFSPAGMAQGIISGAVSGLVSGIFGGGGMSKASERHIQDIVDATRATRDMLRVDYKDEVHIMQNAMWSIFDKAEALLPKVDTSNRILKRIARLLEGSVSAQGGFYGTLAHDTIIRAHKGEEVTITPRHGRSNLWKSTKYGFQKIHERSIIKR